MAERPRILVFGDGDPANAELLRRRATDGELVRAESWTAGLDLLRHETFDAVLANPADVTAAQSLDAVSREVALPVDEILGAATALLDRYVGHDPEMGDRLRQILAAAHTIKRSIQFVGENRAAAPTALGSVTAARPAAPLPGVRVLVADADDRTRRSAHSLLGRWGCIVETARDGHEALVMARLGTYDAILADIRLPDMNGYEFFRQVRQPQPRARVILMTAFGYDAAHAIANARREGLEHVLYKPFRVEQLLDALRDLDRAS